MSNIRRKFSGAYKGKVALEAVQERETLESLSKKHDVHPNQILRWKKDVTDNVAKLFNTEKKKSEKTEQLINELYKQIGQLKVENEWLKKKLS
jgi:transposase